MHLNSILFLFVSLFYAATFAPITLAADYETLDWLDLLPEADLQALQNRPTINHNSPAEDNNIPFGSEFTASEDELLGANLDFDLEINPAYEQALQSKNIVEALNGKDIRIPGFIVPLEFTDDLIITEFFLVPYFGACTHLPPPPPNQMVLVTAAEGFSMINLYTPFLISGELSTEITSNSLGTSAYSMTLDSLEKFSF